MYREKCINEICFQDYKVAEFKNLKKQDSSFDPSE